MPSPSPKIAVIGLGNMGTAIAHTLAKKGFKVTGWEHFRQVAGEINASHTNSRFLAGARLHKNLAASTDLKGTLTGKDFVFVALPSAFLAETLGPYGNSLEKQTVVVSTSKGTGKENRIPASRILGQIFKKNDVIILSGPSIASEFYRGWPCVVVLAGKNQSSLDRTGRLLETETFRVRFSRDTAGVEWSGILKNIYAIGLGLIDGAGIRGINFKAVFITKAVREMADLIAALGGKRKTVYELAGLGDLMATSLSAHSHNRRLGKLLSTGYSLAQAREKMGGLPEGVRNLRTAVTLSKKFRTPMPLARGIADVVDGAVKPAALINRFFKPEV